MKTIHKLDEMAAARKRLNKFQDNRTWWQRNSADLVMWFSSISITVVLYRAIVAML